VKALQASDVEQALENSRGARVDVSVPAKFSVGDRVITRNMNPIGHTRLPRYARARHGTIAGDYGVFIFPDTHAMGEGRKPQHLYSVRFSANELWGGQAPAHDAIYLDLWDDYLDLADGGAGHDAGHASGHNSDRHPRELEDDPA